MFDRSILKLKARDQFRRLITIVTAKIKINMLVKGREFFLGKIFKREKVMSFMYCYSSLVVDTMIRLCK